MQSYTFEELAERWLLSALKTADEAERQFDRSRNNPAGLGRVKDLIDEASDQLRQAIDHDDEAEIEFRGQTVTCRTVSADLLKLAGNVLTSKGTSPEDQLEGIEAYKKYLDEFDPANLPVLLSLAEAYLRVDEFDEAEAVLRRVLDEDATNRRAQKLLSKVPKFTAFNQGRSPMSVPVPHNHAGSLQPNNPGRALQGEIIQPYAVCHNCGHPVAAAAQHATTDHTGTAIMWLVIMAFVAIMFAFLAGVGAEKSPGYNYSYSSYQQPHYQQPRQRIPCHNQYGQHYYCYYDRYGNLRPA